MSERGGAAVCVWVCFGGSIFEGPPFELGVRGNKKSPARGVAKF